MAISLFLGLAALGAQTPGAMDQNGGNGPSNAGDAQGWLIPIQGDIERAMPVFIRRETRKAIQEGAELIIFEIDTFGGRVDSALQITSFITSLRGVKTVAWVNAGEASMGVSWSAGALIALSCQEIYMAPGTSIGAAAPVTIAPGGGMESAGEKTVAALRSQIASLAEMNGHPVGIALAMTDYDVDLWEAAVDGEVMALTIQELERLEQEGQAAVERISQISAPGKLLSLTSAEALRYGLTRGIVASREELLQTLGLGEDIGESAPSVADGIVFLLSSAPAQILLIILGLALVFLEINTPGFGLPGIGAALAFLLVFGTGMTLGKVGSLEILLFIAGVALLGVEIFLIPGFGIVGISGFLLIGISLVLAMQDFVIPRFAWEWGLLGRNIIVVFVGLVLSIAGIALIALLGPKIKIFNRLALNTKITGTAGGLTPPDPPPPGGSPEGEAPLKRPEGPETSLYQDLLGKTGVAVSVLRPSGWAEFEGQLYPVEGTGRFIEAGTAVKTLRVQGSRIVVGPL